MTQKKILIVTDDAGESFEILYAKQRFLEAGFEPVIAATEKKRLNGVIHDFYPGWNTYIEKPGYLIESDATFSEVSSPDFLGILLIGGRAPEFLRHRQDLIQIVREFHQESKWIWSVCHGIQILAAAGLLEGKKVTCYENCRFEAESCGATWIGEEAVLDGKMITAQTWESHADFYRLIFAELDKEGSKS